MGFLGIGECDFAGSFECGLWGEATVVDEVGDGERVRSGSGSGNAAEIERRR